MPPNRRRIGRQTGGRVALFLETDDFGRDHRAMLAAASLRERPAMSLRHGGGVRRLYGNLLGPDRAEDGDEGGFGLRDSRRTPVAFFRRQPISPVLSAPIV